MKLLVAIATYNEIDNLPSLVDRTLTLQPTADVLVVDDNSPDGTGRWAQQLAASQPRLHTITRSGKLGLGTAVVAKMEFAIANGYDWLVTVDGDNSHDVAEMDRLLSAAENVDVVLGSRYVPGGRILNWPWYRRVASRLANLFAQWVLWIPVSDCSSGYRCYRVSMLKDLDPSTIIGRGYSFYEEVLWRLNRIRARFVEVPITFVDRTAGQSKARPSTVIKAIVDLLTLRLRR